MKEAKEKSILDIITEHAVNKRLDAILFRDRSFLALQKKIDEQIEAFYRLDLSKEELQVIDQLISAHTESDAYYSAGAYRQGFKDCVSLFCETGLVKAAGDGNLPSIERLPERREKTGGSFTDKE